MSEEINLEIMPRADLGQIWGQYSASVKSLKITADSIQVFSVNDALGMKLARTTRLELRQIRIAVEKRRKELGDGLLRETQKINGAAKAIKDAIDPIEARLLEIEEFTERERERQLSRLREERIAELAPYLTAMPPVDVALMEADSYASFLADAKDLHDIRIKREEAAEAARQAEAARLIEERRAVEVENARLRKDAATAAAEIAKERAKYQAEAAAAAAIIAAEKAIAESEKREIAMAMEKERAVAADLHQKKLEEERKAASAPDRQKLIAFADKILGLDMQIMSTEAGQAAADNVLKKCKSFANWINEQSENI